MRHEPPFSAPLKMAATLGAMAVCVLATAARGGEPDKLKVRLRLIDSPELLHVGDKIEVAACVENVSGSDLKLPNWDGERFRKEWYSYLYYTSFPGKPGDLHWGPPPPGRAPWEGPELFRLLAPKAKTPEVVHGHVLLLPGTAQVVAEFSDRHAVHMLPVGRYARKPGELLTWNGSVVSEQTVRVSEEVPGAMKQSYDRVRAMLAAPEGPNEEKLKALAQVAGERHLFAARLVREIWQGQTNAAVKAATLQHLVTLLEFGTAYEAFGELLDVLVDQAAPAPIRKRIMAVLAGADLDVPGRQPGLRIADQGFYELRPALRDKALQSVRAVAAGRDPFLARISTAPD